MKTRSQTRTEAHLHAVKAKGSTIKKTPLSEQGTASVGGGGGQGRMATCSDDGTVRVWDTKTGACLQTLTDNNDWVKALWVSPDGKTLLWGSDDGTIQCCDTATGDCFFELNAGAYVECVTMCHNTDFVIAGMSDGHIRTWDTLFNKPRLVIRANDNNTPITALVINEPNTVIISGNDTDAIRFWDIKTGALLGDITGNGYGIRDMQVVDGNIFIATDNGEVEIIEHTTNARRTLAHVPHWPLRALAVTKDMALLATVGTDKMIRVWRKGADGKYAVLWSEMVRDEREKSDHGTGVVTVAISPDEKALLTGHCDGSVRRFDLLTGAVGRVFTGHTNWVRKIICW